MKKIITPLIIFILFSFSLKATHGVGGDIRFIQTGANSYDVVLRLFRFCEPGAATLMSSETLDIYTLVGCSKVQTVNLTRDTIESIVFGDDCYTPQGLCVESHTYIGTVVGLPNNPGGYKVEFDLCCRNSTENLSGQPPLGLSTIIPDPALSGWNSSPKFNDYPSDGYFCINVEKCIDFTATDADGDSLTYELVRPVSSYSACTPTYCNWANPTYSLLNYLGPGSKCIIPDPNSGCVLARPSKKGRYVISVKCTEWRNGVKIGEVVRDIQYVALNCNTDRPPKLENFPTLSVFKFEEERCFDVIASDPDSGDDFHMILNSNTYQFGATASLPSPVAPGRYNFAWIDVVSGAPKRLDSVPVVKVAFNKFEGRKNIGARFCWNLDECDILAVDSFYLDVLAYSIGCDASNDTLKRHISLPIEKAQYSYLVPNVFTPNGDGENDLFLLKKDAFDKCYDALSVRIYNRWGQKVFESEDAKFSWDGNTPNGKPMAEGTYYVVLQGYYGDKEVTSNFPLTLFR